MNTQVNEGATALTGTRPWIRRSVVIVCSSVWLATFGVGAGR